jgi:GT2 family glycosyltransferase
VQKAVADKDAEIIVADNNSSDNSRNYLSTRFPDAKFLWFDENFGFAKAYNKAVAQAQGDYLLILNPDTLVAENILDEFEKFVESHPDFGIVGGKMIDGTGRFLPESKRGVPTPIVAFSKLTGLYKLLKFKPFNSYYAEHLSENQTGKVSVLTGALMFIKKDIYQQTGGFDEQYFMYGEDIDLSYTLLKSGKQNYYLPTAKIIHFKGESSGKDQAYFQNFLNTTFQFYRKHFRSFPATEFFMKQFFKVWLKLRSVKRSQVQPVSYSAFYFIGKRENFEVLKKTFPLLTQIDEVRSLPVNSLLIFDTSVTNFTYIIDVMENRFGYYRFYFPQNRLLIGSDYKDRIGEAKLV